MTIIIILLIILIISLIVFYYKTIRGRGEGFASEIDEIMDPKLSAAEANNTYWKVLLYLAKNPNNADAYLNFLKDNFMGPGTKFNKLIEHQAIAEGYVGVFGTPDDLKAWQTGKGRSLATVATALDANQAFRNVLGYLEKNTSGETDKFYNFIKSRYFTTDSTFTENKSHLVGLKDKWRDPFMDSTADLSPKDAEAQANANINAPVVK